MPDKTMGNEPSLDKELRFGELLVSIGGAVATASLFAGAHWGYFIGGCICAGAGQGLVKRAYSALQEKTDELSAKVATLEKSRSNEKTMTRSREQGKEDKLAVRMAELDKAGSEIVEIREGICHFGQKIHMPISKEKARFLHDKESIARGKKLKELLGNKR